MFNNNIPTNSIIGNYYGNMIQPQPIGNLFNTSQGYNSNMNTMGGYYNPYSNAYYNPYLAHKQKQEMEAQRRKDKEVQASIWKKLSRSVNEVTHNIDNIEEHIKKYDVVEYEYTEEYMEEKKYFKLASLSIKAQVQTINPNQYQIAMINNEIQKVKSRFPDDMDMCEFFESFGELLLEEKLKEQKMKQKDLSGLYNKNHYNQLINMHSNSSNYFNNVFNKNVSIDDMEIRLPSTLNNEYHERKRKFLESLLK